MNRKEARGRVRKSGQNIPLDQATHNEPAVLPKYDSGREQLASFLRVTDSPRLAA